MDIELKNLKIQIINGSGNSFAITNFMSSDEAHQLHEKFNLSSVEVLTKKICKLFSVDGFIILTEAKNKQNDYRWLFFNNDGSEAEMCGNAARCIGHYTFINHIAGNAHSFESIAGVIEVKVEDMSSVTVTMPKIIDIKNDLKIQYNAQTFSYNYLNTGVPHSVVELKHISQHQQYKELAIKMRALRNHHPDGTNVTFYSSISEACIESISFERGVENYTKACGTGAVAAAYCQQLKNQIKKIEVKMPGGPVIVDLSKDKPYLIGPVEYEKIYFAEEILELWMNSYTD